MLSRPHTLFFISSRFIDDVDVFLRCPFYASSSYGTLFSREIRRKRKARRAGFLSLREVILVTSSRARLTMYMTNVLGLPVPAFISGVEIRTRRNTSTTTTLAERISRSGDRRRRRPTLFSWSGCDDAAMLGVATCLTREGDRATGSPCPPPMPRHARPPPRENPGGCAGWARECANAQASRTHPCLWIPVR